MSQHVRGPVRVAAVSLFCAGGIALLAAPASAHVEIEEGDFHAGSEAVITVSVPHGCDGSPTTKLRIQLPESVPTVTPTVNPGWDISLVKEQLASPIDLGEGRTLTERITEVDYTAKAPLSADFRDTFSMALDIPDDAAGMRLVFPTIQECQTGSTSWTQVPAKDQDPEELEHPAPSIEVLTAADDADSIVTTVKASTAKAAGSAESSDDSGSTQGLAIAGLATGVVGMALGGRALAASKGSSGTK